MKDFIIFSSSHQKMFSSVLSLFALSQLNENDVDYLIYLKRSKSETVSLKIHTLLIFIDSITCDTCIEFTWKNVHRDSIIIKNFIANFWIIFVFLQKQIFTKYLLALNWTRSMSLKWIKYKKSYIDTSHFFHVLAFDFIHTYFCVFWLIFSVHFTVFTFVKYFVIKHITI